MNGYAYEINRAIEEYESHKAYKTHSTEWISNRISWCWKFKKITEDEMHNFCDRMTTVFEEML